MITHNEALKIVLDSDFRTETENILVSESFNRVLAENAYSGIFMPPFNKSMVDGYACLKNDLDKELILDAIVGAGNLSSMEILPGHCIKVMTGAPVPKNTELVVMIEDVSITNSNRIVVENKKSSVNVSPKGEDIKAGDKVLEKGTLLKPFHCGILATIGKSMVEVYKKVKVGIIVTGDEIIEPGNELASAQIYNSNACQIINNCRTLNIVPEYFGIAHDSYEGVQSAINSMLEKNDVLIITGGVSMGDFDYVAPALKNSGMDVKFDSILAQPGRPLVFATDGKKFCFGMPGNPVSGLVLFETIVKPFLYRTMGHNFKACISQYKLKNTLVRKKGWRKSFYPVKLNDDNTVSAIAYHGSAHLNAYSEAFGITAMEIGVLEINEGQMIDVRQI
ncbi:MAG TPA: molybdopterin molybdotransferase MoeA [Bacteroidales bacterium]|nr:molybdopterin molybdotransferase MoeA [Bacteroidales bacterium]